MEKEKNIHHKIPKSKLWLTNNINCQLVDAMEHKRWHWWCWNDTPVEALCRVLLRNEWVWNDNFLDDLLWVLDNYLNDYYAKKTRSWFIKSEIKRVNELEQKL